jgi:hypothetical protein
MGLPFNKLYKYLGGFNPLSWFAKNEPGAWYDPSDLTTLFQDSAGTLPAALEYPVGLMLDKSKGLALGAELVTNGDFSNGTTGWSIYLSTISNVNNTLRVTAVAANTTAYGTQALTGLVIGSWYALSITQIVGAGSSLIYNYVGPTAYSNTYRNSSSPSTKTTNSYFLATATTCYITVGTYGPATENYADFDNISVRQIAGNHAFQATNANRPILSARVNLLTKTEDFSDAVWSKTLSPCTVANNQVIAPDGNLTAGVVTASGTYGGICQINTKQATSYTHSVICYFKSGTVSKSRLTLASTGLVNGIGVDFILSGIGSCTTPVAYGTGWSGGAATITSINNGWYLCTLTGICPATTDINIVVGHVGTAVSGDTVAIWHPDLRPTNSGALLPPYQRVNTASDYDSVGFPLYLKCNGTSSAMSTNSIDFTATDKMTVVTGVRKLSELGTIIMELSATASTGAFLMFSPINSYGYYSGGTVLVDLRTPLNYPPPNSIVLTAQSSISTPIATIRVNSSQVGKSSTTQGSGNFGNYPLFLFARNGTTSRIEANFYGAIIRGAQSDTASVTQTENYMAQKTGITF